MEQHRLHKQLIQRRHYLGLSQAKLAEKMDVVQSEISRLENGGNCGLELLLKWSQALDGEVVVRFGNE